MVVKGMLPPLVFVASLAGCDQLAHFDRSRAESLLQATALPDTASVRIKRATVNCLLHGGYLTTFMGASFTITPTGKPFIHDFDYNMFGDEGHLTFVPGAKLADVQVTGIGPAALDEGSSAGPSEDIKQVEFTADYDLSPIADGVPIPDCFTKSPAAAGKALAKKYDDGWRIEFTQLPPMIDNADPKQGSGQ